MAAPVDASYLADTVVLLRYFEARGEVRQAISVVKKRSGPHTSDHPRADSSRARACASARRSRICDGVLTGVPRHVAGTT